MPDEPCFLKVGCADQFGCSPLHVPMDYDSFAPFVIAKFESSDKNGGLELTVGNDSYSQRPNTAIIKSMEFGYMDKPQARLEIVDEAGGEFGLFVDALRKCGNDIAAGNTMKIKFGWVKSNCEGFGERDTITFGGMQDYIELILHQIDVSYGEGLIKYTLQGTAMDVVTTNQRRDETYGPGWRLTDAIQEICRKNSIEVIFASVSADGSVKETREWPAGLSVENAPWEWNTGGTDGPKGSWQANNNNVLSVISNWISSYRSKDDRGMLIAFNSKKYNELWLWKDPNDPKNCPEYTVSASEKTASKDKVAGQRGSLGTFIVNGGKCSPVLRFDPKINFIAGQAGKNTGGNPGSAESTQSVRPAEAKAEERSDNDPCPQDKDKIGPENQATITQNAKENYAPDIVHKETLKSNMAHISANMLVEFEIAQIQAELTIIGMPTSDFVDFTMFLYSPISIIVINPFYISGERNEGCGDWSWLANSGCNELLSDNQYICQGVNHSIKEGSYTTTIKVFNVNKQKYNVG